MNKNKMPPELRKAIIHEKLKNISREQKLNACRIYRIRIAKYIGFDYGISWSVN